LHIFPKEALVALQQSILTPQSPFLQQTTNNNKQTIAWPTTFNLLLPTPLKIFVEGCDPHLQQYIKYAGNAVTAAPVSLTLMLTNQAFEVSVTVLESITPSHKESSPRKSPSISSQSTISAFELYLPPLETVLVHVLPQ